MKTKKLKTLILLFVFLFCANSAFSQKDDIFNKKMYLGINSSFHFIGYNTDLEFERQFHKHWGYAAGLGVLHLISLDYVNERNNVYSPSIYLETPIEIKFYSKILNVSIGANSKWLCRWYFLKKDLDDDSAYQLMIGPYLTISKDFTVFRKFKIEPYIQGYIELYQPGHFIDASVGLKLKYTFN